MQNNKINILIVTHQPFPNGLALTNRIISYAKGLLANGATVKVLIFKPTEENNSNIFNSQYKGIYSGIPYEYTGKATIKNKNIIIRRFQNSFSLLRGLKLIMSANKQVNVDAIIVCSISFRFELIMYCFSKIFGPLLIKEESEFPEVYFWKKNIVNKLRKYIYIEFTYKFYDGILLITRKLIEYFSNKKIPNKKMLHVPMTVEFDRFNNQSEVIKTDKEYYAAYIGSLNIKKDGIDILISSFSLIAKKFPLLKLYLIGKIVDDFEKDFSFELFKEMLIKYEVQDKVIYTGVVGRNNIIDYLQNATLLVMSRPSTLQSQGGFPTKLGEYLASANPVVVTDVGEISDYLVDGESAYISKADDIESFAQKMEIALLDPEKARQIGKKGREVALEHFDYLKQTKSIIYFIRTLKSEYGQW